MSTILVILFCYTVAESWSRTIGGEMTTEKEKPPPIKKSKGNLPMLVYSYVLVIIYSDSNDSCYTESLSKAMSLQVV